MDVGANVGYHTGVMTRAVRPTGRVVAIEPAPVSFALLRRTLDANSWPQVVPVQVAAGASSGQLSLQLDPLNWGNHSFVRKRRGSEVLVPVDTLKALLPEQLPSPVRLVKMDVQGWEGHVLAGAAEVLDKPIVVLECKSGDAWSRRDGPTGAARRPLHGRCWDPPTRRGYRQYIPPRRPQRGPNCLRASSVGAGRPGGGPAWKD